MGAVRRYGHLLAGIAVVLVGCSDADTTTTATATPSATPHTTSEQPEATATPVHPTAASTPTPAEIPSGPDDPGWAEHLGLTEEELERRRASDDFLEWAEPRRARESPGFVHTHGRLGWYDTNSQGRFAYINHQAVWQYLAQPLRDRLLAKGRPIEEDIQGLEHKYGYLFSVTRDHDTDLQRIVIIGRYEGQEGRPRALVDQAALELESPDSDSSQRLRRARFHQRRATPHDVEIDGHWEEVYERDILPALQDWVETELGDTP